MHSLFTSLLLLLVLSGTPRSLLGSHPEAAPCQPPSQQYAYPYPFYASDTVTVAAGKEYGNAGPLGEFLLGARYRDLWQLPLEVPVIDLERTAGGLSLMEAGGGKQTRTLHLSGGDGENYILRSVRKDNREAVPGLFHGTMLAAVVQDQVSSINPYAALVASRLAEAVGVPHTAPRLVYVPSDPRLGEDHEAYEGMLALFELRVDEKQLGKERFGCPDVILDTEGLFERLRGERGHHRVDQHAFARARLFDLLIGDSDRHEGQWLWLGFEDEDGFGAEEGTVYRPVPLDRDFAFSHYDGLLMELSRLVGLEYARKLTPFDGTLDVPALTYNASKLDRRLLHSWEREDWVAMAGSLQVALSDAVIEEAVRAWPAPVFDEVGLFTIEVLKARRDRLLEAAETHYEMLVRTFHPAAGTWTDPCVTGTWTDPCVIS